MFRRRSFGPILMSIVFPIRRLALMVRSKLVQGLSSFFSRSHSSAMRRLAAERTIIEDSLLFDSAWYLRRYPDVAQAEIDPISHYLTVGWLEGRDPGPMFTTSAYLEANEDVSKSGMNPLLHFAQFGLAEGRDGFGDPYLPSSFTESSTNFAEPHECLSLPRSGSTPVRWNRGYQLDRNEPRFVAVGNACAGYAVDSSCRAEVEGAVEWLRFVSGSGAPSASSQELNGKVSGQRLVDAWHVNGVQLRTRWDGDGLPAVVRAFQCDEMSDGEPRIVGEGLVASTLDAIDLHLLNPFFPILFVFAAPEGGIRRTAILAFPSLCRGGTHYPELLSVSAQSPAEPVDVTSVSQQLSETLVAMLRGEVQAAVEQLQIDLAGCEGNGPLFRTDLRSWLTRVLRVSIDNDRPSAFNESSGVQRISSAPAVPRFRRGGGTLVLPADAAPTIGSLVAHRAHSDQQGTERAVPMLLSRIDPSQSVLSIDVPARAGAALGKVAGNLPWFLRTSQGAVPARFPAAAIRTSGARQLSDAELMVPVSESSCHPTLSREPVTWMVRPDDWTDDHLDQMIQTAALQLGAAQDVIALVGLSASASLGSARKRFSGDVTAFRTPEEAIAQLKTPLAALIGGGVLLHDPRTAHCFSSILADERISTASCVMVSTEKRAGTLKTVIVDGGAFVMGSGQPATPAACAAAATRLWQGSYPVLRPSAHLWATRSDRLASWSARASEGEGAGEIHACSAAVTATLVASPSAPLWAPEAPEALDTATKVDWLV